MKHTLVASLALALVLSALSCRSVPVTGRRQFAPLPASTVNSLAADAYQQFLADAEVVTGTPAAQMVDRVGCRVRVAVEQYLRAHDMADRIEGYDWSFQLVENEAANAFAMPGGKVVVFTGMMDIIQGEAELAAVLAHEIAHVVAYHGNERMSQQLAAQFGGVALSELIGEDSSRAEQLLLTAYGAGAQVGVLLPYSRLHETEADRLGLLFMAEAGYDPRRAVDFWRRMQARGGPQPPEFLSTHPSHETRIENLNERMAGVLDDYRESRGESSAQCAP